ncbi:unnamed protein product [Nyctereutes procyonoides]|uniref:(raccoon dog) hypothetical protein n=1 Tax=Nyctereutes procyonoides TaxID=34880 RepID=A0A811ZSM9_NYCPR|nr:unnamed protein product [Nyctereutes procyonoides]
MGTGAALCGCSNFPLPPPNGLGPLSRYCLCVANFSSVSFTVPGPPSVPGNNTHCHQREKKRTPSIWAELNHEAQKCPGDWEPAFCAKDHSHHVSGLTSYRFLRQVMTISELEMSLELFGVQPPSCDHDLKNTCKSQRKGDAEWKKSERKAKPIHSFRCTVWKFYTSLCVLC